MKLYNKQHTDCVTYFPESNLEQSGIFVHLVCVLKQHVGMLEQFVLTRKWYLVCIVHCPTISHDHKVKKKGFRVYIPIM